MIDISGFLAGITIATVFTSLLMLVFGYFVGSNIKSAIKIMAIFLGLLVVLVLIGLLNQTVMSNLIAVSKTFQPLYEYALKQQGSIIAVTPQISMFSLGFVIGLFRG